MSIWNIFHLTKRLDLAHLYVILNQVDMNDHTNDWRNEINWPYARRFLRAHVIMWMFRFRPDLAFGIGDTCWRK